MDISKLSKKPELVKITIDDADIVEMFGEPIDFWLSDGMGISTYFGFYKLQEQQDDAQLNELLRKVVLREDGTPSIGPDETLPISIIIAILVRIGNFLGKSTAKTSTLKTGKSQK
jgi:hypothetical protein